MSFESRLDRLLAGKPDELADAVRASRLVFRVAHLLQSRIDAALAPLGIDMREYLALVLVGDDADALRPSDLGATLDATRTQVTRLLDGLEARGLVRRAPNAADRRSLQLESTPAGKALTRRAAQAVHPAYAAAWAGLGPESTRRTLRALARVHGTLSGPDAP
ncbi:MAG: MarR family winged helix-turn-helix transcriptional regulator [Burkholderiaceae bacterium]